MTAVRLQRAAAAEIVVGACDEVHRAAAARVKVGVKRIAVRVDGHQHPLTVGVALKNQLLRLDQHIAVAAPAQRLAARVLKTWVEDFVDEDTGEVVSIERNNVIVDRETVLQEEHIDQIIESGAKTILLHKENLSGIDFSIIYNTLQKDPCNSEKEAVVYIYRQLRASEPPDEATARDVIEMMMAGASAVQVGAANLVNPYASKEIVEALPGEMERLGIEKLSDIIGCIE